MADKTHSLFLTASVYNRRKLLLQNISFIKY